MVAPVLLAAAPVSAATGIASVEVQVDVNGSLGIEGGMSVVVSSPDGGFVYVTSLLHDDVAVFSRDSGTGKLTHLDKETDLGVVAPNPDPIAMALSPGGGAHLYVASRAGAVTTFDRDGGTGLLTRIDVDEDGIGGVTDLAGAAGIVVSPDGDHVYVTGENPDSIVIFSRDSGTGFLTFVTSVTDATNIKAPNGLAISPDSLQLYVTNRTLDSLSVFTRTPGTGLLTFLERHEDGLLGVDGLKDAVSVAISPNGASVYVVGEGEQDGGVAVFSRNPGTGALTFVEFEPGDADHRFVRRMSAVAVSPDGTKVYAAGRNRDAVALFDRNTGTGALTYVSAEKLQGATALAVSPDDLHIYSSTRGEDGLLGVFRLSDSACSLTPSLGCTVPFQADKSLVLVKDKTPSDGDLVVWKWNKGPITALAAFGDPVNTTNDLILCIYQDTLGTPQLVFRGRMYAGGACAGKPCWKASTTSYKYKDKDLSPDGILVAGLKSGTVDGAAKIKVKGKGTLLQMPTLPLVTPVVVQLQRTGACWETTHTTPTVTDPFQFKSKDN